MGMGEEMVCSPCPFEKKKGRGAQPGTIVVKKGKLLRNELGGVAGGGSFWRGQGIGPSE